MSVAEMSNKYSAKGSLKIVNVNTFESPLGKIVAAADDKYIYTVCFEDSKKLDSRMRAIAEETNCSFIEKNNDLLYKFERELAEYFEGKLKNFTVPIQTIAGSEFQKDVWDKLQKVPYGETQTYGDIAEAMGRRANHARAVGSACGANGHILIIPCHRVVASGSKGGFSSGLDRKEWLLNHEQKHGI